MKCEDISKELIAYLDRRANSAERRAVEEHLGACAACRARAEDFRKLWGVLDEMPVIEPSLGFDARLRARAAAEPRPRWFGWLVPQPRLAFSMAFLLALSVWMARLPGTAAPSVHGGAGGSGAARRFQRHQGSRRSGELRRADKIRRLVGIAAAACSAASAERSSDK